MPQRIMVVDDTPTILEVMTEILGDEGYEVVAYSSAAQALSAVEDVHPDVIILDWLLNNEAGGWSVLRHLRDQPTTKQIPIIVCSGARHALQELEHKERSDAIGVLHKPFAIDDLLAAVSSALETT